MISLLIVLGLGQVPAAALTAFARSEDRTRALRSGFEMHLSKPVDPGELVASILTLVRRHPAPYATSEAPTTAMEGRRSGVKD